MSTTPLKDEMKKQVQQLFFKTLQKYPQAKKKAQSDSELHKLAKDLYDMDEASGLLSILPTREMPTLDEYFLWCKEVIVTLTG